MSDSDKKTVSYSGTMGLKAVQDVVEGLVTSLENGKIVIQRGKDHVALTPANYVEIELTGRRKKHRESVELRISWRNGVTIGAADSLAITSAEPPTPESLDVTPNES